MLKAESISYKVGSNVLLRETAVQFAPGQFHVIMGANGAGKSTLLKLLAGEHKPSSGTVYLEDRDINSYSKNSLAVKRAVLSQQLLLSFPITVEEIVMMGRYPYFPSQPSAEDISICKKAMAIMNVSHLADRDYTTLSGGEAQKVQMSRVLAQIGNPDVGDKKVLFLDEPVSHLDVKFQYQLLQAARDLCQLQTTVIAVLHDINLAISFADRLVFMKEGKIVCDLDETGSITPTIIEDVFDISSTIIHTKRNKPVVIF